MATMEKWLNPSREMPKHKELVVCHIGYGESNPYSVRVAEYDEKEDCFVFGVIEGSRFSEYAINGFVRTEMVTGWMPLPEFNYEEMD